ncbi:unnamed protein product [Penicillium olsonii]|uniref:Major facilitator superfamily (MFS) profile domain-containing protein n=1 Tax=Penicillium olsonii TaxID=99116 RepID=A0A9W4MKA7_PENOL|nr:unnamed protein product [Penicillium olsonii]
MIDTSGTLQGPYVSGLVLLFASIVIFTASHSVAWYIVARVLQGAATAMVSVAGLSIVTDAVDRGSLGQMFGYIGTAMTLGFMSGPVLGGVAYQVGGFYAVFGMAFGIVALDLFLRLAVVEKRIAERWLCFAEGELPTQENGYVPEQPLYGATEDLGNEVQEPRTLLEASKGTFALGRLIRQPRIIISLWAVIVGALVVSAFDAVRDQCWMLPWPNSLTVNLDASYICPKHVQLERPRSRIDFPPRRLGCNFSTILRFVILAPTLFCLRFVEEKSPSHVALLCVILVFVGMCIDLSEPALLVEIQHVLDDMEAKDPGVFGGKGAVAQAFGLENMAHFGGLALGPLVGGFVEFRYGWKVMTLGLAALSALTAVPMLWLSGRLEDDSWTESADEEMERELLLGE